MAMANQWDSSIYEQHQKIKEAMKKGPADGVAKINEYLEEQENTPLNIAVTGESGVGKSTFINAFRGIQDDDEGAAPTGAVETTTEVKPYPHPNNPNVTLWELPGVGTPKFPADKYLELVGLDRFDFFIIISATRFTENNVKLAQEIKRMGKKFYFLRSKIDSDIYNEQRRNNFNKESTLDSIRKNCIDGLRDQGIEDPQVFLVSSFELHEFDFHLLEETLEKELPLLKRNAFLCALSNISKDIIKKKKDAYQAQIKYYAAVSVAGAAVRIPGVSLAVDVAMAVKVVTKYMIGFGIDKKSLKRLAEISGVPYSELESVITLQLGATKITSDLILKVFSQLAMVSALMAAEETSRFFSFLGIPIAMVLSGVSTYRILNFLLNLVADDAQRVFEKAFKKTS